jgi:hypothetical protein
MTTYDLGLHTPPSATGCMRPFANGSAIPPILP